MDLDTATAIARALVPGPGSVVGSRSTTRMPTGRAPCGGPDPVRVARVARRYEFGDHSEE